MGLWEAGPGKDTDTEVDEVFVVLAGAGTVTFVDESTLRLCPGVAVRLYAGDRTRWNVTHRLRKLYLA
ncbi:cupin domain-containing protein [Streptomyces thinghirensis]|uniref:cupin domain-containing protein n=1 Tax=Streptomyces thinghirensis TaxID=551547 RepID=UPI0031ECEC84